MTPEAKRMWASTGLYLKQVLDEYGGVKGLKHFAKLLERIYAGGLLLAINNTANLYCRKCESSRAYSHCVIGCDNVREKVAPPR